MTNSPPPPLASSMRRLGTEAALETFAEATAMRAAGRDIALLCVGQPDFLPPPHVREAAARACQDGPHGYSHSAGLLDLREALARYHEADAGRPLDPNRFVVTPGGKSTAWLASLMLGEAGVEILIPDPFFPIYESAARFTGATTVAVPLLEADGFALDPQAVAARITPRTRLLVCNSPTNPTGRVMPKAALDRLVEVVLAHPDLYILSDEIYSRITFGEARHHSLLSYPELDERLILLNGFSKTYSMTGWRVGYGYWPASLVPHIRRMAVNSHSCTCNIAQVAARAALEGPQTQVEEMRTAFARRGRLAAEALRRTAGVSSCLEPEGAFYLFPRVEVEGMTSREVSVALLAEEGLAINPGTAFGSHGEGYLRFSLAAAEDELLDGVARLARWLERRRGDNRLRA